MLALGPQPEPTPGLSAKLTVLADLPAASRDLLDALAVLGSRCRLSLVAQVAGVTDGVGAIEPLLVTGLARWWPGEPVPQVEFSDDEYRSAVYARIPPHRRAELHRVAATLVAHPASWRHRVAAARGVDGALAGELDQAARDALSRHDIDRAATYLLWAADLSENRHAREQRLLTAVLHLLWWHQQRRARTLMPAVDECAPSPLRECVLGEFAFSRGALGQAHARLGPAIASAGSERRFDWLVVRAGASLASAQYLLGQWGAAAFTIERAFSRMSADRLRWVYGPPLYAIAAILAASRGEHRRAAESTALMRQYLPYDDHGERAVYDALTLGTSAHARADYTAMVAACEPVTRFVTAHGPTGASRGWQAWWRPLHIAGLIGVEQFDEASAALKPLASLSERVPDLTTTVAWLTGWLIASSEGPEAARQVYEAALAAPAGHNDVALHRALLEHAYGNVLVRLGDQRRAVHWLRHADRRYEQIGAHPFRDRCVTDLARCGSRAGARHPGGGLTRREREVSELVAQGLTNRQAAIRLQVSDKTIEYHLSNIFAKLGISSRRQLRIARPGDLTESTSDN